MKTSRLGFALVGVCLLGAASIARGQTTPGVTDSEIVIGSCSALEGPSHTLGVQTVTGAKAYFSMVNEEGGVHGRKLRLVAYDDSYDPGKTQICFDRLMKDDVFARGRRSRRPRRTVHRLVDRQPEIEGRPSKN